MWRSVEKRDAAWRSANPPLSRPFAWGHTRSASTRMAVIQGGVSSDAWAERMNERGRLPCAGAAEAAATTAESPANCAGLHQLGGANAENGPGSRPGAAGRADGLGQARFYVLRDSRKPDFRPRAVGTRSVHTSGGRRAPAPQVCHSGAARTAECPSGAALPGKRTSPLHCGRKPA